MLRWGVLFLAACAVQPSRTFLKLDQTVTAGDGQIVVEIAADASYPLVAMTATATTTDVSAIGTTSCTASLTETDTCTISPVTDGATYAVTTTATTSMFANTTDPQNVIPTPSLLGDAIQGGDIHLWFDAGSSATIAGSGSAVYIWYSLTGDNEAKAAVGATESFDVNALLAPTFEGSGVAGKPTVVFDGSGELLSIDSALGSNTPHTIFAAAAYLGVVPPAGTDPVYATSGCSYNTVGGSDGGFVVYADDTDVVADIAPGVLDATGSDSFRVNGSTSAQVVLPDAWFVTTQETTVGALGTGDPWLAIGSYEGGCGPHGRVGVGELIDFQELLDGSDVETVESYLMHKWRGGTAN